MADSVIEPTDASKDAHTFAGQDASSNPANNPAEDLLAMVKVDPRVNVICEISGDRVLLSVPLALIEQDPVFTQLRAKSPKDLGLLRESMKATGSTPVYMPCIFIMYDDEDGELRYFIVDGHQRLTALRESGIEQCDVQWITRWTTRERAMADATSLQFARFEPTDEDIVSILATGKLTIAEVAAKTGKSEATIRRMADVASEDLTWLRDLVSQRVLGYAQASKLVKACANNQSKLDAMRRTIMNDYAEAKQRADAIANRIKSNPRKRWDRRSRDRAKISTHFKGKDWALYVDTLDGTDALAKDASGEAILNLPDVSAATTAAVRIGDDDEWNERVALFGFAEQKIDDLDIKDLNLVISQWNGDLFEKIVAIRDRLAREEALKACPMPSANPEEIAKTPQPPAAQSPDFNVVQ